MISALNLLLLLLVCGCVFYCYILLAVHVNYTCSWMVERQDSYEEQEVWIRVPSFFSEAICPYDCFHLLWSPLFSCLTFSATLLIEQTSCRSVRCGSDTASLLGSLHRLKRALFTHVLMGCGFFPIGNLFNWGYKKGQSGVSCLALE